MCGPGIPASLRIEIENLQLANPHATFEDIVPACKMAEMHEVFEKLPKGWQAKVYGDFAPHGTHGERNRLQFADCKLVGSYNQLFWVRSTVGESVAALGLRGKLELQYPTECQRQAR